MYVISGHGMMYDGGAAVLINEYHRSNQFYKLWAVEVDIRDLARRF